MIFAGSSSVICDLKKCGIYIAVDLNLKQDSQKAVQIYIINLITITSPLIMALSACVSNPLSRISFSCFLIRHVGIEFSYASFITSSYHIVDGKIIRFILLGFCEVLGEKGRCGSYGIRRKTGQCQLSYDG